MMTAKWKERMPAFIANDGGFLERDIVNRDDDDDRG